jgi:hypothetical protein
VEATAVAAEMLDNLVAAVAVPITREQVKQIFLVQMQLLVT